MRRMRPHHALACALLARRSNGLAKDEGGPGDLGRRSGEFPLAAVGGEDVDRTHQVSNVFFIYL